MASVMALRVLVEGSPNVGSICVARGEVDSWEDAYLKWFERVGGRFPKNVDAEEVKRLALDEFARLRKVGVNKPKVIWAADAARDLRSVSKSQ
jgi:hypothetical protein